MHDYFKTDYDLTRNDALLINWDEIVKGDDMELDWHSFKLSLEALRDKWIPFKKHKNGTCKWVNNSVKKARRAKIKAWIKYREAKKCNDPKLRSTLADAKTNLKNLGIKTDLRKEILKRS